jgi:proton-dependent oligopeptide transporter, POT family
MNEKTLFGHPRGLFVLFFTEMWERFSYYGMRAILLLFLLDKTNGGLGFNEGEGGAIYGMYTFSVYLLSLPGGWLADNILGQRKAIWFGGISIMIGHILLAIPGGQTLFFVGLGTIALGTGLLKPNISSIVSELYPEGGAKRDAAFSIFYMGINLGSFLGILIVGYLGQKIGWHYGFGASAIAMFLGLIVYRFSAEKYLKEKGKLPKAIEGTNNNPIKFNSLNYFFAAALVLFVIYGQFSGLFAWDSKKAVATSMGVIAIVIVMIYFLNLIFASGLNKIEVKRIIILFILFWGAVLFWAGFEQQGSTLQIFADRHTIIPFGVPSSWFQNFNPFYIITLAPVIGALWVWLEKSNLNPPPLVKFSIGILLLALGYYIMVIGANLAITGAKASALFLTFTYLFHTIGELCLSPVGLSAYTKLAPKKYLSQLMGIWFVAAALGNLFAGLFAGGFDEENIAQMPQLFMSIVWFSLIVGGGILLLSWPLRKWMGGIK